MDVDGTIKLYQIGRGDLRSPVARQKVTFTPTRANTVRPYGFDGILVISAHTVMTYDRLSAFSFDAKGAKEKANGQKHSRLEHERMARAQYSLFFPIFASASSSTGRADVKIKKKTPKGEFRSLRRATKALPLETANCPKSLIKTFKRRTQ